jgi:murein DD-endopeptidase MepM/ murein hydrolase activator NlpD
VRLIAVALMLLSSVALADDERTAGSGAMSTSHDPRTVLVTAFADQRAAVDRAANAVELKLADAVEIRKARVRAAYKLLRVDDLGPRPAARGLRSDPGLSIARRRAAVRWLLARDRVELGLLADEASRLLAARRRIDRDAELATTIDLPAGLIWPVRGTIARRFGPYEHEKSGATLTRRGLDLEVAPDAGVLAPAAGTVAYAGPIRGLDQGVIVDHGAFLTVIGKLDAPTVRAGDRVDQGTPIGTPRRHRVYLEVRVEVGPGGTPIDPEAVLPARP